jgi:hypothetical protein
MLSCAISPAVAAGMFVTTESTIGVCTPDGFP